VETPVQGDDGPPRGVLRGRRATSAAALGLVALTAALVVNRMLTASDGTVVHLSNAPWRGDAMPVSFVLDEMTGIRARDVVVGIDGHALPTAPHTADLGVGDQVTYSLVRDGAVQDVTVTLREFPVAGFLAVSWPTVVTLVALVAIAAFVFRRRPDDRTARVLLLAAGLLLCGTMSWLLGDQPFRIGAGPPWFHLVGEVALAGAFAACIHFAVAAPGSQLHLTRRRVVAIYSLPFALHAAYLAIALPAAAGPSEVVGRVVQVSYLPSSILPPVIAVLLVVSYRSMADRQARQRMRWVLLAIVVSGFGSLLLWTLPAVTGGLVPPEQLLPLTLVLPTIALAAAILRYRLFDIEILLRRSLVYGLLTATIFATYLAGAWLLSLIPGITPTVTALLVGGLVAAVAPAFSSSLRRRVGRLVFGERHDPFEVVARLGRIDAAADPSRVLQDVVDTLASTLRLSFVEIELRSAERLVTLTATSGVIAGPATTTPLGERGRLGHVLLAVRRGHEPFGPADRRLLDALSDEVAGAASTILLTTELQRSRERIVTTREDERRRMHHRLHDGLGPSLAAGVMQLEVVARLLEADPGRALALLRREITTTRELVRDVRGIVLGLRPPALDQLGLAEALRSRARSLVPIDADGHARPTIDVEVAGDLTDLPAAAEVAAFWIAVEAMSNTVRHAQARSCRVRVEVAGGLRLEIEDDGCGLPEDMVPSGGMVSMRERAEELGGTCRVRRGARAGTVVEVLVPIHVARTGDDVSPPPDVSSDHPGGEHPDD
jgi:two-component system, NarL family, sensor kinase